jgi:hypothetical protein
VVVDFFFIDVRAFLCIIHACVSILTRRRRKGNGERWKEDVLQDGMDGHYALQGNREMPMSWDLGFLRMLYCVVYLCVRQDEISSYSRSYFPPPVLFLFVCKIEYRSIVLDRPFLKSHLAASSFR